MHVDAFVALKADQMRTGGAGERAGDLRLPHPRFAFEQQRLAERHGQVHGERQRSVG